jgi:molybdopterin-guanine dinucleotide biosynthesis protein A
MTTNNYPPTLGLVLVGGLARRMGGRRQGAH